MIRRKVLIVPVVRCRCRKTRFLVAKDRASGEWTLLSGTCEPYEHPVRCALRELYEETKGLVRLRRPPKRTRHYRFREKNKRVDVYFVPLRMCRSQMKQIEQLFALDEKHQTPEFLENETIRFQTWQQFVNRRPIWSYILRVMKDQMFQNAIKSIT